MPHVDPKELKAVADRDMELTTHLPVGKVKRAKVGDGRARNGRHPNSLAALAAHRPRVWLRASEGNARKRCKHCRRVVVRGMDVCYFHGGAQVVRQRRKAAGQPVGQDHVQALRNVRRLFQKQLIPLELLHLPLFVEVARLCIPEQFGLPRLRPGDVVPTRVIAARLLCREMAAAWAAQLEGDPVPWARVVAKAMQMGFSPTAAAAAAGPARAGGRLGRLG